MSGEKKSIQPPANETAGTLSETDKKSLNNRDFRNVGQYGASGGTSTTKFNSRTKNSFLLKDYNFSNSQKGDNDIGVINSRISVPYIQIYEFQPDLLFKWRQKLKAFNLAAYGGLQNAKLVGQSLTGIGEGNGFETFTKNAKALLEKASSLFSSKKKSTKSTGALINELFIPKDDNEFSAAVLESPIRLYREFFEGKYHATYQIPCTDEFFINANGHSGWGGDGKFSSSINVLSELKKIIDQTLPSEVPIIPEWQNKNSDKTELGTEFYLYNDTLEHLASNLSFLYQLAGGAFWIQVGWKQQPTNIYRVEIPGVVRLMYASMHITVEHVGNRRKRITSDQLSVIPGTNIELPFETMFPDAYKVVISFQSLVPNNYNTFIDYLMRPSDKITTTEVGSLDYETGVFTGRSQADGKNITESLNFK